MQKGCIDLCLLQLENSNLYVTNARYSRCDAFIWLLFGSAYPSKQKYLELPKTKNWYSSSGMNDNCLNLSGNWCAISASIYISILLLEIWNWSFLISLHYESNNESKRLEGFSSFPLSKKKPFAAFSLFSFRSSAMDSAVSVQYFLLIWLAGFSATRNLFPSRVLSENPAQTGNIFKKSVIQF